MLGSLVEVVNVAIFFKNHFTRIMRSLCRVVLFMMFTKRVQYTEQRYSITFVEECMDEILMRSVLIKEFHFTMVYRVSIFLCVVVYSCITYIYIFSISSKQSSTSTMTTTIARSLSTTH